MLFRGLLILCAITGFAVPGISAAKAPAEAPATTQAKAHVKAMDWAPGFWALQSSNADSKDFNCAASSMQVSLDVISLTYTSAHAGEEPRKAKILDWSEDYIKIQYTHEARVMDDGKPQIWIMLFNGPDEFLWIRQDWIQDGKIIGATAPRIRCRAAMS